MFLTIDEIERLTGYKRKRQQCEKLDEWRINYRINARGEPIVAAAVINGTAKVTQKQSWQPNQKLG
jgi:hypothetical protein